MIEFFDAEDNRGLEVLARMRRDWALRESDWTQIGDAPADKAAWAIYRQALRDLPSKWVLNAQMEFPNPPGYVEPVTEVPAPVEEAQPSTDAG